MLKTIDINPTESRPDRRLLLTRYLDAKAAFLLENERLCEIRLEADSEKSRIGEIYIGKIKSIADGIDAAFVEYKKGLVGFLPLNQITPDLILNRNHPDKIACEQELLVQVVKDPMHHKDATLTTELLFSGKYMVLTPTRPGMRFSRKLRKDEKSRLLDEMNNVLENLFGERDVFLSRYGLIIRTNAADADFMELFYELHELFHDACRLMTKASTREAFSCLYQDAPFYRRILRDQYDLPHIQIITDSREVYDELQPGQNREEDESVSASLSHLSEEEKQRFADFMQKIEEKQEKTGFNPEGRLQLTLWEDESFGLLQRYGIASSVEKALSRRVWLKSGGFLIIEPTEALTVVDVNSGKAASKKKVPEEFNLRINLEAAQEIAWQLRLRNLSGMIIVDFINLEVEESKAELMRFLRRELKKDPVGANLIDITALGLVEITRRKKEPPLSEKMKQLRQNKEQT